MKKFFRLAIVFAIAGAALLTGCTKDYSVYISDLQDQVTALDNRIKSLETAFQNGAVLNDVAQIANGIRVTYTKDGKTYTEEITNGKDGKDGVDGKDGAAGKNGTNGTNGTNGKDGKDGTNGTNGKDGKDGTPGTVVTISDDGYWVLDGVKTDKKAIGTDGKNGTDGVNGTNGTNGKDGVSWEIKNVAGKGLCFVSNETPAQEIPVFENGKSPITAVLTNGVLTLYGVEGAPETGLVINTNAALKSLAFVPEVILDGLGLIELKNLNNAGGLETAVRAGYAAKMYRVARVGLNNYAAKFVTSAPVTVSYRLNPSNVDETAYAWDFISRKVDTRVAGADATGANTIVKIKDGTAPVKRGSFLDFEIVLQKELVKVAATNQNDNDLVALRAIGDGAEIVSDYSYLGRADNNTYNIINKQKYYATPSVKANYGEEYVEIANFPAKANVDVQLLYNAEQPLDLVTYVETYANEFQKALPQLDITPSYEFCYAGKTANGIVFGATATEAPYLAPTDNTNQNAFVTLTADGKIKVNPEYGKSSINRTPLVYVRSYVTVGNGKYYLADAFLTIQIVEEKIIVEPKPWQVLIKHTVTFDYSKLTATATYTGEEGQAWYQKTSNSVANKDLNVDWDEMNKYVFDNGFVDMSYEDFGKYYDVENPKLIVAVKNNANAEPTALLKIEDLGEDPVTIEAGDKANLIPFNAANLNTIYSKNNKGLSRVAESVDNWRNNTTILNVKLDKDIENVDKEHHVYVLYHPKKVNNAWDWTKTGVVIEFVYNFKPHTHTFNILNWKINPDYKLGSKDVLNETIPGKTGGKYNYYGDEPYKTYAGVRIKGRENEMVSALIEHFEKYTVAYDEDAEYSFQIVNFPKTDVTFAVTNNVGQITNTNEAGTAANGDYAKVTLTGTQLKDIVKKQNNAVSPDIKVVNNALISQGFDVLVRVTETCKNKTATGTKTKTGYYFVVFKALDAHIVFNEFKLGTYKEINDYIAVNEFVYGIFDADVTGLTAAEADKHLISKWENGAWTITDLAKESYNFKATGTISVELENAFVYSAADPQASFGGRLLVVKKNQNFIGPAPQNNGTLAVDAIEWWNMGTDLQVDKAAQFQINVKYTADNNTATLIEKAKGDVIVLSTANSKTDAAKVSGGVGHAYHKLNGDWWDPQQVLAAKGIK